MDKPVIKVGDIVKSGYWLNGMYKVISINHRGTAMVQAITDNTIKNAHVNWLIVAEPEELI